MRHGTVRISKHIREWDDAKKVLRESVYTLSASRTGLFFFPRRAPFAQVRSLWREFLREPQPPREVSIREHNSINVIPMYATILDYLPQPVQYFTAHT